MSLHVLVSVLFLATLTSTQGVQHFEDAIRDAFYGILRQSLSSVKVDPPSGRGVVKSCGPPDANFSIEWEPKVVNPEGHIVVYYDYVTPHAFKHGTAYVALYFNKIPNPIFEDTFPIGCDKIGKYIPCPLKAGLHLHGEYPYSNLLILKGYDGTYRIIIKLMTDDKKIMFCANATVTISSQN